MGVKKIKIAIISDLHCHHSQSKDNRGGVMDDSYLKTDMLRTPANDHPVESLIQLIESNELEVCLTLCPGDFTNKSDKQGFISGWDFSLEINNALNSNEIIATIGNHDVDVYGVNSSYSIELAKGIKKGFPIKDSDYRDVFWSRGCVFVEKEDYRVLVINSSHFHYNRESAIGGRVDDDLIDYVDQYMDKVKEEKISIVMSHHHPIDHSRLSLGEYDKISNADRLLEILGKHRFDLFVHGHKHDPLLRYHSCYETTYKLPVLSSGSFSSTSNLSWTGKRNNFHIIDVIKEDGSGALGKVKTWTFMPRSGWSIMRDEGGFDAYTGFGFKGEIVNLVSEIENYLEKEKMMKWEDLIKVVPGVQFLVPSEARELEKLLNDKGIILSSNISLSPEYLFNTKSN
ncbi:metallophosphoesterase family protein [Bizionia paragorgiae]|uniref:metallophosphoesterase family protein n=1 Tax=Bizionia paragorgiae TaxID=283786 RepID=UPI003A8FB806